eukprot:g6985.t1
MPRLRRWEKQTAQRYISCCQTCEKVELKWENVDEITAVASRKMMDTAQKKFTKACTRGKIYIDNHGLETQIRCALHN